MGWVRSRIKGAGARTESTPGEAWAGSRKWTRCSHSRAAESPSVPGLVRHLSPGAQDAGQIWVP